MLTGGRSLRYKYVHVFNSQDFKFIPKLLNAVNSNEQVFKIEDHLFVTPHKKVYDLIKQYPNVVLTDLKGAAIVNSFGKNADWVIIHSFSDAVDALLIKRKIAGRVIWRTWGHDLFRNNEEKFTLKYILKVIREYLFSRKIEKFYAVAGANCIDEFNIFLKSKCKRFYRLPYTYEEGIHAYYQSLNIKSNHNGDFRIMIGHSGDQNNNHIEIINRIRPYLKENITIVLVLAYMPGNQDYVQSVIEYAKRMIPDNLEIVDKFIPFREYIDFLNNIDVAIFDSKNSYALGNISILTKLGKTIYLNDGGIIHNAFKKTGFPHYCTREILHLDKENNPLLLNYNPDDYGDLCAIDDLEFLKRWKTFLSDLSCAEEIKEERSHL